MISMFKISIMIISITILTILTYGPIALVHNEYKYVINFDSEEN
jgi:hypothetical protein